MEWLNVSCFHSALLSCSSYTLQSRRFWPHNEYWKYYPKEITSPSYCEFRFSPFPPPADRQLQTLNKPGKFFTFCTRCLQRSSTQGMFPQVFMRENHGGPVAAQIRALRCIARLQAAQSLAFKLIMTVYEHVYKS